MPRFTARSTLDQQFLDHDLVSLQYPLGLILSYSVVTRIPFLGTQPLHHSTLLPQFPTIYPFIPPISFPPSPSPTAIILLFCPGHLTLFLCNAPMHSLYLMIAYASYFTHQADSSSINCTTVWTCNWYPVVLTSFSQSDFALHHLF